MFNIFRVASMTLLIVGVALAAAVERPEWAHDLEVERCLFPEQKWSALNAEAQQRNQAKQRVIDALIEGRLTLFEAAAHFRRWKDPRVNLSLYHCGNSEEERLCRQVITYLKATLSDRNSVAADVFGARLEEELRRHLEQHRTVILPEVADGPAVPADSFSLR